MHPSSREPRQHSDAVVAHEALDAHWALRSLAPPRRARILAEAAARLATGEAREARDPEEARAGEDAVGAARRAAPTATLRRPRRPSASRLRAMPHAPEPVSDAEILHLAGAYDLAGREALLLLQGARPEDPTGADHEAAGECRTLDATLGVAAAHAFTLLAALPLEPAPTEPGAEDGTVHDADAALLHRLLQMAALAEVGGRRVEWLRWMEVHAPALAARLPAPPDGLGGPAAGGADPALPTSWEARLRALVVGAWLELLRRSGPSGLETAMALLARVREEREPAEAAWIAALERTDGELAAVRARFRLFALAHVADAAVDTLLHLRHGPAHGAPMAADRQVRRRLQLAREAGAGDVQLDVVLTWLREAAHRVIARASPQLEIAVGD